MEWDRCTKCILSARVPKIKFDDEGVCNFCRDELFFSVEQEAVDEAKKRIAEEIAAKAGRSDYDAVMCYSGGKDSTYTMLLAIEKYGLKVLAFTLDNGFIPASAMDNIRRMSDRLGVDQIVIRPSLDIMKKIYRASALHPIYPPRSLVRISSNCYSCISMVNVLSQKIALEKDIPFVVSGFNLGQVPSNAIIYKSSFKLMDESREKTLAALCAEVGENLDRYYKIGNRALERGAEAPLNMNILCVEDITEEGILEKISEVGWVMPKNLDGCTSNCRLNAFNNAVHERALGYNPYELELSRLIRKGLLSRELAMEKINTKANPEVENAKEELGITEKEWDSVLDLYM